MRSRDDRIPPGPATARALEHGLVGTGGRLDPAPATVDAATDVAAQHDERLARRVARFAHAPDGSFVWTRDDRGEYWLGRLDGPWRYDASPEARGVDLVHVRPCMWTDAPVPAAQVPPAVTETFARGGRNWQRIRADGAAAASLQIWRDVAGRE